MSVPSNSSRNYEEIERMKPLLQLVFYSIDKVKRFRLSKEGKMKAERNRQKVEEEYLKMTHQQRQELAQLKKDEKRRLEKEKMLNESDPEKQRKWEEKEYKRELKRKTPKMKQLKVKAMWGVTPSLSLSLPLPLSLQYFITIRNFQTTLVFNWFDFLFVSFELNFENNF